MARKMLTIVLLVLPALAKAQVHLYSFFRSTRVHESVITQIMPQYAPSVLLPSKESRLTAVFDGYVQNDGSVGMMDSTQYIYTGNRGGDLNSRYLDYSQMNTFQYAGGLYEGKYNKHYDALGRLDTVVEAGRYDLDTFSEISRTIYAYGAAGTLLVALHQTTDVLGWQDWKRISTKFDAMGRITGDVTEDSNPNNHFWDTSYRSTNIYNAAGKLTENLVEDRYRGSQGPVWAPDTRIVYTYDLQGNLIRWEAQQYHYDSTVYYDVQRFTFYYNQANVFVGQVSENGRFKAGDSLLTKTDSLTIAPHTANRKVPVVTGYWRSGNQWLPSYRASALLTATGDPAVSLFEWWDGNGWEDLWRDWSYYNHYGQMTRHFNQTWHNGNWYVEEGNFENRYYYEPYNGLNVQTNVPDEISLMLYPVPAGNLVTVALALDAAQTISANITDAGGRTVSTWTEKLPSGLNTKEVDTRSLPSGSYFLNIRTKSGSLSKAFTVQH